MVNIIVEFSNVIVILLSHFIPIYEKTISYDLFLLMTTAIAYTLYE